MNSLDEQYMCNMNRKRQKLMGHLKYLLSNVGDPYDFSMSRNKDYNIKVLRVNNVSFCEINFQIKKYWICLKVQKENCAFIIYRNVTDVPYK